MVDRSYAVSQDCLDPVVYTQHLGQSENEPSIHCHSVHYHSWSDVEHWNSLQALVGECH